MDFAASPKQTDSSDTLIGRLEEANARAYERERERLVHTSVVVGQSSDSAHDTSRQTLGGPKATSVTPRPADQASPRRRRQRLFFGCSFLLCIGVAAVGSQSTFGNAVKQKFVEWTPQFVPSSSQPLEKLGSSPVQREVINVPAPRTVAQALAADVETPSAVFELVQVMARDLATLREGVEELKAKQDQITRRNAKIAEQVEANQEQMARDNAKLAEQLKTSQEQAARNNAKVAEQIDASQQQIARIINKTSKQNERAKPSARRPLRIVP